MLKLSTINQIVEGILEELGEKSNGRMIANEAVIYYKTAMICEDKGVDKAMEYFTGTHNEDEYQEFDMLRERRNFWSHVCYTEAYDKNTGVPRNAQLLLTDLRKAKTVLEQLRKIKDKHMDKNREKIINSLFW